MVQVDELRMRVRELEERERKESKKLADEDALRKIRVAEETIEHLQKKLAATKQVCVGVGVWVVQCSGNLLRALHLNLCFYLLVISLLLSSL